MKKNILFLTNKISFKETYKEYYTLDTSIIISLFMEKISMKCFRWRPCQKHNQKMTKKRRLDLSLFD